MNNELQTIGEMYEAFGRGDIEAILSRLSEEVEWDYSAHTAEVPWLRNRRGREEAAGFFRCLAEEIDFKRFEPKEFLAGEDVVVVLVDIEFEVRKTGARVTETDGIHVWRFDGNGRVARFRHGVDTLKHYRAWVRADAASGAA